MTATGGFGSRVAEALARVALWLYPPGFRSEAGEDLVAHARTRGAERASRGVGSLVKFLLASVVSLIANAMGEWRDELRGRLPSSTELRATARALIRAPAFALTVVVTLTLGLATSVTAFALFNGVLLRPLPYGEPESLVTIWSSWTDAPKTWVSAEEYALYVQQADSLDDAAAYFTTRVDVSEPGDPARLPVAGTTPNLLSVLRVEPVLGRIFTWDEAAGESTVVMISHRLWQERFGGGIGVLGAGITTGGNRQTIIGVLPPGFRLPRDLQTGDGADIVFPFFVDLEVPAQVPWAGGNHGLYVVGRVAPGGSAERLVTEVNGLADRLKADEVYPEDWRFSVLVFPLIEDVLGPARQGLQVLLVTGWFVLLIACANVANLLLARAEQREPEVGVRAALGASRGTLLRLVATESLALGAVAGALGIALSTVATRLVVATNPWELPRIDRVAVDAPVLGYALALAVVAIVASAAVPALRLSRASLLAAAGRTRAGTTAGGRLQGALVVTQAALAVVLLIGTALMLRTVAHLARLDPGFRAESVVTARVSAPETLYPDRDSVIAHLDGMLAAVQDLPEVERAAAVRVLPLAQSMGTTGARVVGDTGVATESRQAEFQVVTPGYFEIMRIPLLAGRAFTPDDRDDTDAVVINEAMAEQLWPGEDPLDRRLMFLGEETSVIGVVGDVSHEGLLVAPRPGAYRLHRQIPDNWIGAARGMTLTLRTDRPVADVAVALRRQLRQLAPSLPPPTVVSMAELQAASYAQQRFVATALGSAGVVALMLAAVGLYGVLAYSVSRSSREIGIRMALGVQRRRLVGGVVARGVGLVAFGAVAGSALALGLTETLAGFLHGVSARDPATFLAVVVGLSALAALASFIPARRAANVDPVRALE